MRIALTMRITQATGYDEPRDSISHDWIKWVHGGGDLPVFIPNAGVAAPEWLDALKPDLLLLTGGDDIGSTPSRDETENALLDHALMRRLPVVGVCRGLQLANVRFGGHLRPVTSHVATTHQVAASAPLADIYGDSFAVNSFHNVGIAPNDLADGLLATATDEAGYIEGVVHRSLPFAAVMWHPERRGAPAPDRVLIRRVAREGAFWA